MNHRGGTIYVKVSEFVWSSLITGCGIRTVLRSQGVRVESSYYNRLKYQDRHSINTFIHL